MREVLTSAQMRAVEQAEIASGSVTGAELMERAGSGLVAAILQEWPELGTAPGRAVVLCGPGNNGGDGYVAARLLAGRGWQVLAVALAEPATPDARAMRARWQGPVRPAGALDWPDLAAGPEGPVLVLDAMFGTGLTRPVAPGVRGLIEMARESRCRIVAVDLLSGLCADSGRVLAEGGPADDGWAEGGADLTVTFERAKCGHHLAEGARLSGRLRVVPIGLDRAVEALQRARGEEVAELAAPPRGLGKGAPGWGGAGRWGTGGGRHKYDHGHALVLSGGPGRGGAALLAALGALRIGAGLVTLGCPPAALIENAARLDAVMLRPLPDAAALAAALEDRRIAALALGPGLGLDRARLMLPVALAAGRPAVLDADALTAFAGAPGALFAMLHRDCVLTPHGGEFARLFPDLAARLAAPAPRGPAFSRLDAAREAAARAGCTLLLKGADTVIATPGGLATIASAQYEDAAPWLATAGSGDVLAGFIAGLLARGLPGYEAAAAAAWLHAACARAFGPGLIAEDLPDALPGVLRTLGAA